MEVFFDFGCFQRDRVNVYKEAEESKAQNVSIVVFVLVLHFFSLEEGG